MIRELDTWGLGQEEGRREREEVKLAPDEV